MSADIHFVTNVDDLRLSDYRDLKEHHLKDDSGKFVAESERVVRQLLASGLTVDSLLVTAPRLAAMDDALPSGIPIYVAPQIVMDQITGYHVHRGCLAIGRRPPNAAIPADARTVIVLEDLVDTDNLGAIVRNAAAFGVDALVLSPRCADPFYRKAIRVSMGSVFTLPVVRTTRWPEELLALKDRLGFSLVGAVLDNDAVALSAFVRPERVALLLGSEGPGLTGNTKKLCDARVTIPMAPGRADSLNVATAGAVFLYHLSRHQTTPEQARTTR